MKTLLLGALMILTFGSFTSSHSRSALTYTIDFSGQTSFNYCTQQPVTFSGSMLYVISPQSKGRYRVLAKPQDLNFTDANGERFSAVGMTSFQYDASESTLELVNNMLFIGEKGGSKMLMNQKGAAITDAYGNPIEIISLSTNIRCQ